MVGGIIYVGNSRRQGVNQQVLMSYIKSIDKHNFDILAGFESYDFKTQSLSGSREKLYNPLIPEINNAIKNPSISSSTDKYATQGWLGRVQYDYDGKYFGSLSYRRDASSRFAPENRWGNFWSASAAWDIAKEKFMQDVNERYAESCMQYEKLCESMDSLNKDENSSGILKEKHEIP